MINKDFFSTKHFFLSVMTAIVLISVAGAVYSLDKIMMLSKQVWKANPEQQMYVTGVSKVRAMPDIAYVSYTIKSESKDPKKASETLSMRVKQTIDALVASGIAPEKIYLSQYQVNQVDEVGPTASDGFTPEVSFASNSSITQNITVEITGDKGSINDKLTQLNKIAFEKKLIPTTNGNFICLDFSNKIGVFSEARKQAVENARREARDLVAAAGLTLGRIVNISDNMYGFGGTTSPYNGYCSTGLGSASIIEEQEVPVSVSINFEVK